MLVKTQREEHSMDFRKFENTYIVRMDKGEDILEQIGVLALKEHILSLIPI